MSDLLIIGTKEGVLISRREGDVWQPVSRSLTRRQVNSVSAQDGNILAGTTEGVYRSDDLGQTWHMASEGLSVPKIRWLAHHPDRSGRVLAGTEPAAIFLSRDGGKTWAERPEVAALRDEHGWYLPYSPEAGCVRGFAFHGDRVYAAVEQGGLLRSDDALRAEAERRLVALTTGHDDLIGASVTMEELTGGTTPYRYQATAVVFKRPGNVAATEKAETSEGALKGALSAVERQVRELRERLRETWT